MLKTVVKINKNLQNAVRDECDRKKSVCVLFLSLKIVKVKLF